MNVDTSALLKLYVVEAESEACEAYLAARSDRVAGRHTLVEVSRNLRRLLEGEEHVDALAQFTADRHRIRVVELDKAVCGAAAAIAEQTGARTLDALHVAAALSVEEPTLVTYDVRLGDAARRLRLAVIAPA